ncbi:MAG TPA: hypothetical protein VF559_08095 [Caulobacteraceae bacterium]
MARSAVAGVFLFGLAASAAAQVQTVSIPEGTEIPIRFDDKISSGTNTAGDRFSISTADEIVLANGVKIPEGYRGVGEVVEAEKRGFMGKAGKLNVRFNYIKIGDTRVRLRGNKGGEGKGAVGATVALTVLFGPLGLLKKGKEIEINPGQTMTAYADDDVTVRLAPPPAS